MNSLFQSYKILTKKKKKRERERERERDLSHMSSFLLNWQTLIDTSLFIYLFTYITKEIKFYRVMLETHK